jgi:tripartite-type tricarboxylate transporter receptor subunit TctC
MRWFAIIGYLIAGFGLALPGQAQTAYPTKPVRLIVGFPAGMGSDTIARLLAERLSTSLKQQVIVENRPGQGGSVALSTLAKAPADGYTIMLSSNGGLVVNPHLFSSITYDTLNDFRPVSLVAELPGAIVASKAAPFSDLRGMLEYARANPGKVNFASLGTFAYLWMWLIQREGGVQFTNVPYPGSAQAMIDLLAGRVDVSVDSIAAVRSYVVSGDLKLLATGPEKRLPMFPNTPTIAESGLPGIYIKPWLGIVAPRGTPDAIVKRLNGDINAAMDASLSEKFQSVGALPRGSTPEEFGVLLREELAHWKEVVRMSGAKPE